MFKDLYTNFEEKGVFLSTYDKLDQVRVPLFGLGSLDDIMFIPETLPDAQVV